MEVEIKNIYVFERNDSNKFMKASMHVIVKLSEDIELNLKGILACRKNERWFFQLPYRTGECPQTGNSVKYQLFSFKNNSMNKVLFDQIYEKAPPFIEGFLASNPQPVEELKPIQEAQPLADEIKCDSVAPMQKKQLPSEPIPTLPAADSKKQGMFSSVCGQKTGVFSAEDGQKKRYVDASSISRREYRDPPARKTQGIGPVFSRK